jgi:hypothetical protein
MQKETRGLQIIHQPKPDTDVDVDIVAVHGLGGDSHSTWTSPNGHLWLRDSLPQALENPPADFGYGANASKVARVMTFGYDANILTRASSQRSFIFGEALLTELTDRRPGQAVRTLSRTGQNILPMILTTSIGQATAHFLRP